MLGLVLCGGQSTRMGSDKGMMRHSNNLWAQVAVDKLERLNMQVLLSINPSQISIYKKYFLENQLVEDDMKVPAKGPLLGILTAHLLFPMEDLMIFACDMLAMETEILRKLIRRREERPDHDAYLFLNKNQREPLSTILTANALNKIYAMVLNEHENINSLKFALNRLNVCESPEKSKYFLNVNAYEDLNGLLDS
jgi:molybdopterin-guanine dinucleotide biosynthesis protein A